MRDKLSFCRIFAGVVWLLLYTDQDAYFLLLMHQITTADQPSNIQVLALDVVKVIKVNPTVVGPYFIYLITGTTTLISIHLSTSQQYQL